MTKITTILIATLSLVIFSSSNVSASVLKYDVNCLTGQGTTCAEETTQEGWTAVNLNGINNVTFESVGGAQLQDRNRGLANTDGTNGDVANNDMWRDFVFAYNSGADSGMDILVSGLLANHMYSVDLWAFDEVSNGSRNMTWNGKALNIPNSPDPSSLSSQTVSFFALSDASGVLTLSGRVGSPEGACCNVFVNGFQVTSVPEPTAIVLMALGLFGLRLTSRKK